MTYHEDLSPYQYVRESIPSGVRAVNVGWLEPGEEYAQGSVPDGFIEALAITVKDSRQMKVRGWHTCELPHIGYAEPYPTTIEVAGQKVSLGGAEVRVVANSGSGWPHRT
jgi:hypothetical protein